MTHRPHLGGRQRGQSEKFCMRHAPAKKTLKEAAKAARRIEERRREIADEAWLRRLLGR